MCRAWRCKNARQYFLKIKCAITAGISAFTVAFGWLGWLVLGWVVCMVIDWITGSLAAARNGTWASARARDGIWHKVGMIIVVSVGGAADLVIGLVINNLPAVTLPFEYSVMICPVLILWYIFTELGSILENGNAIHQVF